MRQNEHGYICNSQNDLINSFEYGNIKHYMEVKQKSRLKELSKDQFLNLNYRKRKSIMQKKMDEKNEIFND